MKYASSELDCRFLGIKSYPATQHSRRLPVALLKEHLECHLNQEQSWQGYLLNQVITVQ